LKQILKIIAIQIIGLFVAKKGWLLNTNENLSNYYNQYWKKYKMFSTKISEIGEIKKIYAFLKNELKK